MLFLFAPIILSWPITELEQKPARTTKPTKQQQINKNPL